MSATTLATTVFPSAPNLTGEVHRAEVRLTFAADRTVAVSAAEARDIARWLNDAAREAEVSV